MIEVDYEIPGFSCAEAVGPGQHQICEVTATPETYLTKPTAVPKGQNKPPHLTPHWLGGDVNSSVCPQSHHIALEALAMARRQPRPNASRDCESALPNASRICFLIKSTKKLVLHRKLCFEYGLNNVHLIHLQHYKHS